jgi:hypothetical protein
MTHPGTANAETVQVENQVAAATSGLVAGTRIGHGSAAAQSSITAIARAASRGS